MIFFDVILLLYLIGAVAVFIKYFFITNQLYNYLLERAELQAPFNDNARDNYNDLLKYKKWSAIFICVVQILSILWPIFAIDMIYSYMKGR